MKQRFHKGLQGSFIPAQYDGANKSGVEPLGSKILLLTDKFSSVSEGDIIIPETMVDRYTLGSESGVVVAVGPDAFGTLPSGKSWTTRKPIPGDHVYYDKFAGLLVRGNDGLEYRVMDDACVGAIYTVGSEDEVV